MLLHKEYHCVYILYPNFDNKTVCSVRVMVCHRFHVVQSKSFIVDIGIAYLELFFSLWYKKWETETPLA